MFLYPSKLSANDPLVENISPLINSWASKKLSFAGTIQLISSVLYSIQVYWASRIFILPKKIIKIIEQKFCSFLWSGGDTHARGAKVVWDQVCVPKKRGRTWPEKEGLEPSCDNKAYLDFFAKP